MDIQLKRYCRQKAILEPLELVGRELGVNWSVQDKSGKAIFGQASMSDQVEPVMVGGALVGSICSSGDGRSARILSLVLSGLVSQEVDKKRIASEVLEGYETLGALKELTRQLSDQTDAVRASSLALDSLNFLTKAQGGCIAALSRTRQLRLLGCIGDSDQATKLLVHNSPFVLQTLRTGKGELVTDTSQDKRIGHDGFLSLMCAPLTWGGAHNGLVLLGSAEKGAFTANHFELLNHVALLTAAAVAHARNIRMLCTTNDMLDNPQPALAT